MLQVSDVHKQFRTAKGAYRTVLRNIGLTIEDGQAVALLGENGAGKSVLLKVISGIMSPTSGSVRCAVPPVALIELGAAFQSERNAIDNLRSAYALQGLRGAAVSAAVEEAIAFSGLDVDDLDKPVKQFSSGMLARLGFSFVVASKPRFLISDEVLAVGDDTFQRQCISWLEEYVAKGGTLLLVSHNLYHVQRLCDRGIWLQDGRIERDGNIFEVCQDYLAYHEARCLGSEPARQAITLHVIDRAGIPTTAADRGETMMVRTEQPFTGWLRLGRLSGEIISECHVVDRPVNHLIPTRILLPGRYAISAHLEPDGPALASSGFRIRGHTRYFGSTELERAWQ